MSMHSAHPYKRKFFAFFFLTLFGFQTFYPGVVYAVTSGPAQPEMQKFEPAGTSDMVDLFTGDFKYNIPLLDVGGYPVNLAYQSGTGMEDEATWVGTGWSLNPGAVNRNMRGLPDDFNGDKGDKVSKSYYRKEFKKVGGKVILKVTGLAHEIGKGSVSLNIYKDNYYGIGASLGASLGFNLAQNSSGSLTAGLGIDISSDVRDGASITPNLSLTASGQSNSNNNSGSLSGGFTYNTRAGLKSVDLGLSFATSAEHGNASISSSAIHDFGQTYIPTIQNNINNDQKSLNFDLGPAWFAAYGGIGGGGYYYHESIQDNEVLVPAYGYMNYTAGREKSSSLLDFNREKDGVYIPGMPSIAVPVSTHDYFTATGQAGSQQFRPYYSGNYVVFDKTYLNKSSQGGLGVTVGFGNLFQVGGRVDVVKGQTETKKWTLEAGNSYLDKAEAKFNGSPSEEPVYFKAVGETNKIDQAYYSLLGMDKTEKIKLAGSGTSASFVSRGNVTRSFPSAPGTPSTIKRTQRDVRNASFSFLNADMASQYGLDKKINSYDYSSTSAQPITTPYKRIDALNKKSHHISEITVTGNDGKRMVYGIPVYNNKQVDASFSIDPDGPGRNIPNSRRSGLIEYDNTYEASKQNDKGRDHLYTREETPGYATSYLLTGVLSPDYVDIKEDGITDDDLGTAIKFNYSKLSTDYNWRAPYGLNTANYNEGYLSDKKDDKANYSYGEKEIWNLASIESKTMIAIFRTSGRQDGLGVMDERGDKKTSLKLKKLDKIDLYSKADWLSSIRNGTTPTPIKVVHFEYDYSLYSGMPNNSGEPVMAVDPNNPTGPTINLNVNKGKLTLKRVYFTFGSSRRGETNPYEFTYDQRAINTLADNIPPPPADVTNPTYSAENNDNYTQRETDRWGTYKQSWYNRLDNSSCDMGKLNNSEFPYSLQKNDPQSANSTAWEGLIDRMASKWQLNAITTPAGSVISIVYESDDYAYVQNRRAMQMCFLSGIGSGTNTDGLITSSNILINLPVAAHSKVEFVKKYLEGQDKIFYKIFTDIDGRNHWEYVHGYASIDINNCSVSSDGKIGIIRLIMLDGYNPIAKGAWQTLKSDLPQYAYDNYDNSDVNDAVAAIKSIITSFTNLREFLIPFEKHAKNSGFANRVCLAKSMIRLCCPDKKKTGGGSRVKKIMISDEWQGMTQSLAAGTKTAVYGQTYDYTIKEGSDIISSGIASYEPQIGNEENPFHEPVNYTEKVYWSSDRNHFVEKPYCESYFPAAGVGYSKVTVTSIGNDNTGETGYIENEFFTAKDFPTIVDDLTLDQNKYQNSLILQLFASTSIQKVAVSQGFKIELNDMHGKQKSVKVHNKGGDIISQSDYFYNVKDENAPLKELNNDVDVLGYDGTILSSTTVGTDVDFISDVRESNSDQIGTSVGAYGGAMIIFAPFPIVIGYGSANFNLSITSKTYRSVCAVKVLHHFGILKKIRTMQNGSVLTAENLLWDGQTGEVLLTKNQNEFDDYTYAFTYPAYMAYEGMGEAYKNLGIVLNNFSSDLNGLINAASYPYLFPGDELISINGVQKGWVIKPDATSALRFIDAAGNFISTTGPYMIMRSGRRNLLTASAGTVVMMSDPRQNGSINLDVNRKILDSKAVLYNEQWSMPVSYCPNCPIGYEQSSDGQCIKDTSAIFGGTNYEICAAEPDMAYSACGSYIYSSSFNVSGTSFNRTRIPSANNFWIGTPTAQTQQCSYMPILSARARQSESSNHKSSDSIRVSNKGAATSSLAGPLNRCGIWNCPTGTSDPTETWIGFSKTITVPFSKQYYIGMAADNRYRFKVDGNLIRNANSDDGENFKLWHIYPVFLTNGQHIIEMEGYNSGSVASFGAEVYNNTATEIQSATSYSQLNLIFSTKDLLGRTFQTGIYSCPVGYALNTSTTPYSCRSIISPSAAINPYVKLNPYFNDVLGNWRPQTNFVYTVNRNQQAGLASQNGGTDIRYSGSYSLYNSFWQFTAGQGLLLNQFTQVPGSFDIPTPNDLRWVWANQSIYFDQKGNEVESRDALKRYGSALFGYSQSVAIAVGANARHNEIAFDGFEDYDFNLGSLGDCKTNRQLDWGFVNTSASWSNSAGLLSTEKAHTGKYSYKLTGNCSVAGVAGTNNPIAPFLGSDAVGHYKLLSNERAGGFSPVPNKKYVLSMWVHEDGDINPTSNRVQHLKITINGDNKHIDGIKTYVVEGWKRVDLVFTTPTNTTGNNFQLDLEPTGTVYIDDIRIVPFDGQLNSYVYDAVSMRLMAQLDENNFATLYEYDDEGTPVRVKKETEKGIMTIKESRQSFRKR